MNEDDFFDEDEALDYIIYEDLEKENKPQNPGGCFSVIFIALVMPIGAFYFWANPL